MLCAEICAFSNSGLAGVVLEVCVFFHGGRAAAASRATEVV